LCPAVPRCENSAVPSGCTRLLPLGRNERGHFVTGVR
jgi:hypothetical protein